MQYTIRSGGARTKRELFHYYFAIVAALSRWVIAGVLSFFALIAWFTGNKGALAVLALLVLTFGLGFNVFKLRIWLPGWRKGSVFTRTLTVALYTFVALLVLLMYDPRP